MTEQSFSELLSKDRRLVILRLLHGQPGYALNESVLQTGLEAFGHRVPRDQVRTDITWLAERGLVKNETVAGRTLIATLTECGGDVATGRASNPGVKRPSPGSE